MIIQYWGYKGLRWGALNGLAVPIIGLFPLSIKHSDARPVKTTFSCIPEGIKFKNHVAFPCKHAFPEQFSRGTKKQLGKSVLCFFFQGVLKLVRNLVLCLGNARPLNSPLVIHPLAPQHKQHCPNTR